MTDCKRLLQQRITTSEQNGVFTQNDSDRWRVEIGLHQFDARRSGSQGRWNLLLWLAFVTTVTHVSSEFIF